MLNNERVQQGTTKLFLRLPISLAKNLVHHIYLPFIMRFQEEANGQIKTVQLAKMPKSVTFDESKASNQSSIK